MKINGEIMKLSLTDFILGKAFIDQLPEGAKRAIEIASYDPQLIQTVEETASYILAKVEDVDQIIIITGFPYKSTFETDGLIGAYNLAEALMSLNKEVQLNIHSTWASVNGVELNWLNFLRIRKSWKRWTRSSRISNPAPWMSGP